MNGFIVIAIVVVVVLAGRRAARGAARRRDTGDAVGSLASETRKRDRQARKVAEAEARAARQRPRGREGRGRSSAAAAPTSPPVAPAAPVAWTPPDPETLGVTRRQFLNRSIVRPDGSGHRRVRRRRSSASSGRRARSGFGSKIRVGKVSDIKADIESGDGFLYKPEGRMWITEYPAAALPKAEHGVLAVRARRHGGGRRGALPEVPAPRLSRARVRDARSGSSARATARSTTRSARRRAVRLLAAWTASPWRSPAACSSSNTGQVIQGPPIGTNTTGQEAEGPHCIGGGGGGH